jgi:hypothetical protein
VHHQSISRKLDLLRNHKFITSTCRFLAIAWVMLTLLLYASAHAQEQPAAAVPQLTAHQIASMLEAKNKERAERLNTYKSTRTYNLEYHGFPSHKEASMVVDARFQRPQTKELTIVSEQGSGLLREKVLHKLVESETESVKEGKQSTAISEENYEFTLVGTEVKRGHACYVLKVKPKKPNKFLYTGNIWVDTKDFAVVHISAQPAKNPSFWIKKVQIEHEYEKFGEFWLPVRNTSVSSTRFGGQATLTIDYGKYEVHGTERVASGPGGMAELNDWRGTVPPIDSAL